METKIRLNGKVEEMGDKSTIAIPKSIAIGLVSVTIFIGMWAGRLEYKVSYLEEDAVKKDAKISKMDDIYNSNIDQINEKLTHITVGLAVITSRINRQDR